MIPRAAIDKAIEGGWEPCDMKGPFTISADESGVWFNGEGSGCYFDLNAVALDRTFWRSLGRALNRNDWLVLAHRFYDAVLSEGVDKFWKGAIHDRVIPK